MTSLEQILIDETNKVNSGVNKEQVRIQISQMAPLIELHNTITALQQNASDIEEMLR